MQDDIKQVGQTRTGTPVYVISPAEEVLVGCGRVHNPPARGVLSKYLSTLVKPPACFIIQCGIKFRRIFRLDADGMLFPVTLDVFSVKERERLAVEGIIGWSKHAKKRGTK